MRLVIIDSSLGWLGQHTFQSSGPSPIPIPSQTGSQVSDVLGRAAQKPPESHTDTATTIATAPLAVIVCYVSSHLIARQALAYVDLVVDFYTKLSYLSYNYETTWHMSNASCVSVSVSVSDSDSVSDSGILQFSHMNRSGFLGHIIWPTLTPMRYVLGHRRVRLGFMALRIRRGGNSTPPVDIATI